MEMEVIFDPAKDRANIAKHGLSLAEAGGFDFDLAFVEIDTRTDYGETRYRAFARMNGVGFCLAFTIDGTSLRPISYRRAHEKEMRRYGR